MSTKADPLPSTASLRSLAAALVRPDLVLFPVRHHSPACAWQLARLIEARPPSTILIEGPGAFTPLVPALAHAEARMPLAIYTYAVWAAKDAEPERRRAAYYPFCDHSPELVALRAGVAAGTQVRFIDLDFAAQAPFDDRADEEEAASLLDEQHLGRSRFLNGLARSLGCRDHEELWEHLFEIDVAEHPLDEHVARVAAYCALARAETPEPALEADGTLPREREMAFHIQTALAARAPDAGPVLAVMGGFHAVAMPALLSRPVERSATRDAAPKDAASALIRYSFERLDRLNGYAAGMTSPAWQQRIWEGLDRHARAGVAASRRIRDEAALGLLFDIATELRTRDGVALPMPALTAAYEQVLRLAALRNRPAPARDDLLDAVTSAFVKGDVDAEGAMVLATARRILCGEAIGRVPPGTNAPPLVKDFEYRARRARLRIEDAEPRRLVLDLYRRPEHRVTSRLLQGLVLLGVPFAIRTAGPDFVRGSGLDRLQEHWEYTRSVATDAALAEASIYGVTVPLAVAQRYADRLARARSDGQGADALAAAKLVVEGCVLGLHDHLPRAIEDLRAAIGADASFESVAAASATLALVWQSREPLEARGLELLPVLVRAAYERALYLGGANRGVQGDGSDFVHALVRLREILVGAAGEGLDADLYWTLVDTLHREHPTPVVRGAAAGLLYGASRLDAPALGVVLEGHLSGLAAPREAVGFLRGLLLTAREAAWQQHSLIEVLDRLLERWDEATFVQTLPELRLAFAEMTPKETDRIAESVAELHGGTSIGPLVSYDVTADEVAAHLALSATVRALLAAEGLDEWAARPPADATS